MWEGWPNLKDIEPNRTTKETNPTDSNRTEYMGARWPSMGDIEYAYPTHDTTPTDSNKKILVFSDYTSEYFNYVNNALIGRIAFHRKGLSKKNGYSKKFVKNDKIPIGYNLKRKRKYEAINQVLEETIIDESAHQIIDPLCMRVNPNGYRTINQVLKEAIADNPACLIIDPTCINIKPGEKEYSAFLDLLVEEKERRGVVILTYANTFRGNIKMYKEKGLATVIKDKLLSKSWGKSGKLAKEISKEIKRYEATQQ